MIADIESYIIALAVFVGMGLVMFAVQKWGVVFIARFVQKSHTTVDNVIAEMISTITPAYYWFISFVFALQFLTIPEFLSLNIWRISIIWTTVQAIIVLQIFIDYIIEAKVNAGGKHPNAMVSGILSGIAKIALWLLAALFVLSNLGVNIVSLMAGFGIGGIAIALAVQNILGDLFSSLAIYFDRPFVLGDYIVVGPNSGTVQKIGIKTTRIRALSGEEISIPNKDIAAARVSNFRRMQERSDTLRITVPNTTDVVMLETIPLLLKESVEGLANVRCKSAFLVGIDSSVISFELTFGVSDKDFDVFLAARQQIILNIVRLFHKNNISMTIQK